MEKLQRSGGGGTSRNAPDSSSAHHRQEIDFLDKAVKDN